MVTATSTTDRYSAVNASSSSLGGTAATSNAAAGADRFLKLLVTQMQNQDPLNPMDNAQITSQMAQINTVTGVEKLNETVNGLNAQFVQLQALQGASLVGRSVTLQGNHLTTSGGSAAGAVELAGTADQVKVEVLNSSERVVGTLLLGAKGAGRHHFDWTAPAGTADGTDFHYRVTATRGTTAVGNTPLMRDEVLAVSLVGNTLTLQTRHAGTVDYSAVKAVN